MSPEYAQKESQPLSQNSFVQNSIVPGWLKRITHSPRVGSKICCGYVLTLGIAALGTTIGLLLGNHYEDKAKSEADRWHEAGVLLNNLQVSVLQARSHQQRLISLMQEPQQFQEEHFHFRKHMTEVQTLLSEAQSTKNNIDLEVLKSFLQEHDRTVETYLQETETILKQNSPFNLQSDQIPQAQQLLLNFSNSETALKFDDFSDQLTEIAKAAFQKEFKAEEDLERAEEVEMYATAASMLLSVVVAIILATAITRAIARPLTAATEVAQRVTEEENFYLQAPVTTTDEVGVLATSLNQLIRRVRELLEEQKTAIEYQQQMQQTQLLQSEKMSSLGRMLAGVAHEINNPVNFIYGNITHANEYIEDLLALLQTYKTEISKPPEAVVTHAEEIDLEFLEEDLPKVLQSMQVGAERVRQIILSLKDFSRLDEAEVHPVDLHACIDSTLLILHNRIKKDIQVVRNYGEIPEIEGYAGFLYQVFMNLLSNSLDALDEKKETQDAKQKQIVIATARQDKDWVVVRISDNGSGISPENKEKIFDTFFTTKPRGIGTGLGLAITRQIVEEKHGGRIIFTSQVGEGTEFAIALPIKHGSGVEEQVSTAAGEQVSN